MTNELYVRPRRAIITKRVLISMKKKTLLPFLFACSLSLTAHAESEQSVADIAVDPADKSLLQQEHDILKQLESDLAVEPTKESITILRARKLSMPIPVNDGETLSYQEGMEDETTSAVPVAYESDLSPSQCAVHKNRSCGIPVRRDAVTDGDMLTFGNIAIRNDMPLALVHQKDSPLVTGPSEQFMILSEIPLGTRVAIEKRLDDWYRVITEDGMRGWLPNKALLFGPDSRTLPTKFIKVQGVETQYDRTDWEEDAIPSKK